MKAYPERKPNQRWRCAPKPIGDLDFFWEFDPFDFTLVHVDTFGVWVIKDATNGNVVAPDYWWSTPATKAYIMIFLCANAHP